MPASPLFTDELLDPIAADQPAGSDLRWTAEWDRIKEARRADDNLESGKWAKKERKIADWRLVKELATTMLRERTKDLQIALWLTEANIKLHGFPGLRDGLRITRELMLRYWDNGLYPTMEDGPEDRAGPFEWLNNKLVDTITAIPITARAGDERDYSLIDLHDARYIGSEENCRAADGEFDTKKKRDYDTALANGHISMEMFNRAAKETTRARYEELNSDFQETYDEFKALEKVIDEKFGEQAPKLSLCRAALGEIQQEIQNILDKKRAEEPAPATAAHSSSIHIGSAPGMAVVGQSRVGNPSERVDPVTVRFPLSLPELQGSENSAAGSWHDAEALIRTGQIEKGLAEMTRLAAGETSGRSRFQRKLLLAEACLASKRDRLARSILEELAEQIDKQQLEAWESSELISSVWTRLFKLYKLGSESSDQDSARKLYERLCRLDPWQALGCSEG